MLKFNFFILYFYLGTIADYEKKIKSKVSFGSFRFFQMLQSILLLKVKRGKYYC